MEASYISLFLIRQVTQTAAGAIVSKPKEMASKIKNKFGSADNISSLKDDEDSGGMPISYVISVTGFQW